MEKIGIFHDQLVYFTTIGNILWPFGIFCGHLVHIPRFGILYQEKSGNPGPESTEDALPQKRFRRQVFPCDEIFFCKRALKKLRRFYFSVLISSFYLFIPLNWAPINYTYDAE
jgi:hypothetical protein